MIGGVAPGGGRWSQLPSCWKGSPTLCSMPLANKNGNNGASLVAQWLGICLLVQETRGRALVWEDPTCHGAVGPVSHSC